MLSQNTTDVQNIMDANAQNTMDADANNTMGVQDAMDNPNGTADSAIREEMAALTLEGSNSSADDFANGFSMGPLETREQPAELQRDGSTNAAEGNSLSIYRRYDDARCLARVGVPEDVIDILQAPAYTLLRREVVFMANPVMANPEEITLYTGNASSPAISGSSSEWEVSDANLNRWLMVRSRSITARYPDSGMTTNARRPRESHPPGSVFTLPGSKTQLTWTRSSREEGPSVHEQVRGRKCVDDNGNTYAMLACLRNFRTHEQRLKMRIVPRNLCRDDIEMVLLDVVAYWAKKMLRTRAHSGWTGITATGPVLSHLGRRLGETEYYM